MLDEVRSIAFHEFCTALCIGCGMNGRPMRCERFCSVTYSQKRCFFSSSLCKLVAGHFTNTIDCHGSGICISGWQITL